MGQKPIEGSNPSLSASFPFPPRITEAQQRSKTAVFEGFSAISADQRVGMTGHGFRGVASTILHEQGWPHDHIDPQLAAGAQWQAGADHLNSIRKQPGAESQQQAA